MTTQIDIHPKSWGEEQWIANREFCGKRLLLNKGYRCSMHHHIIKDETFYLATGFVCMEVGGETRFMQPGDKQDILPGTKHRFTGMVDSVIFEFSTRHDEGDSYREEPSGIVPDDEFRELLIRSGMHLGLS